MILSLKKALYLFKYVLKHGIRWNSMLLKNMILSIEKICISKTVDEAAF